MNKSPELYPGADSRQATILIVDDDPSNLAIVAEYLRESEFEVLAAEDGRIALERARLAQPNLILLDVLMPDMDGFETCRRLKEDASTCDIPVIYMTALADTENKVKGFTAGAVDFLTKPSKREEVLARVRVHLQIQHLTRDLKEANRFLESRVEERTAALSRANSELKAQFAERFQAEEALRKSEERFRVLYDKNPTMYFTLDGQETVLSVNPFGAEQLGYTVQELIAQPFLQVFHLDDREAVDEQLQKCLGKKDCVSSWELRKVRKDGSMLWVRETARCVQGSDGQPVILVVCEDITDRKEADNRLKSSLAEKEILLGELYHRTKNMLQLVQSMLRLQAARMQENDQVQSLVNDMENRIMAMALVHEHLYQSHDLSRISMQEYIHELAHLIINNYTVTAQNISLLVDVEPLSFLLDTALPCGLILNELLLNSLKYAFPDGQHGQIVIRLKRTDTGNLELWFTDTGVGVSPEFNFRDQSTLGLQIVIALAEYQLKGKVKFFSEQGISWAIEFSDTLYRERV